MRQSGRLYMRFAARPVSPLPDGPAPGGVRRAPHGFVLHDRQEKPAPNLINDAPVNQTNRHEPGGFAVVRAKRSYVRVSPPNAWRRICPSVSISKGFCRKNALGSNVPCSEEMPPG